MHARKIECSAKFLKIGPLIYNLHIERDPIFSTIFSYFKNNLSDPNFWYGWDTGEAGNPYNGAPYKQGSVGLCFPNSCSDEEVLSIVRLQRLQKFMYY